MFVQKRVGHELSHGISVETWMDISAQNHWHGQQILSASTLSALSEELRLCAQHNVGGMFRVFVPSVVFGGIKQIHAYLIVTGIEELVTAKILTPRLVFSGLNIS